MNRRERLTEIGIEHYTTTTTHTPKHRKPIKMVLKTKKRSQSKIKNDNFKQ